MPISAKQLEQIRQEFIGFDFADEPTQSPFLTLRMAKYCLDEKDSGSCHRVL